jgi:hypothetical protein
MWLRKRSANAGLADHTRAQFARSNDEPSDQQERDQARIRPPAADDLVAIDGNEFVEHERQGFTVSQVVHDYGDVCQAITELAVELNAPISTDDFRTLNRCLDDAIAGAVTEYGRERNQSGSDGESARGGERLGFFAHELHNLMNTSLMAFEVMKTGNVGVVGSTGTVLHRSLLARDEAHPPADPGTPERRGRFPPLRAVESTARRLSLCTG